MCSLALRNIAKCVLTLLSLTFFTPHHLLAQNKVLFDFEQQRPLQSEVLQSLYMESDGLGVNITRPGTVFTIAYQPFPTEWGIFALSPFLVTHATPYPFIFDFSEPVASVSVDAGDFGPSDTDVVKLLAYDRPGGKGKLIDSAEGRVVNGNVTGLSYVRLSVTADKKGIQSIVVVGGSPAAPNSVYYDNLQVQRIEHRGKGKSGNGNPGKGKNSR